MKQFDLYENADIDSKDGYPYFVDVQTDLLDNLNSRVVIPLVPLKNAQEYPKNLCPSVIVNDKQYALMTHQIASVSSSFLDRKEGSLLLNREDIISALDFLLTGI